MAKPTIANQFFGAKTGVAAPGGGGGNIAHRFFGSGSGAAPAPAGPAPVVVAEPEHHSGGLLHTLLHLPGKTASDLEHAAINLPAGAYKLGKDIVAPGTHPSWEQLGQEWANLFQHPLREIGNEQDPLKTDVEQIGSSTLETIKHPLRHPGITLLTVLPIASGASKLAIGAREGATGAAAGSFATRALKSGDLVVHPEPSRSGLGQVVTRGSDALLQNAADRAPGGRAEAFLQRKVGKVVTSEAKQAERNAKGQAQALIKLGSRLTPGEQKALQIVAEQAPLEGRITATSARITGARSSAARANHQAELALLHEAAPHLTVRDGLPALTDARLQSVYDKMAKVAGDRETLLKNLGLLTDEAVQGRKTAAGRVALGAHFVEPTPGRLGQSPTLNRATRRRDALQRRFDKAYEKGRGQIVTETRPRTVDEAHARLTHLEDEQNAQLDEIANAKFGPINAREAMERGKENARARRQKQGVTRSGRRSGASGRKSIERPSVKQERRNLVEKEIGAAIDRNPDHPTLKRWAERSAEIDQLREALMPEPGQAVNRSRLGLHETPVFKRRAGKLERLGGALSIASDEVQRLTEKAVAGREVTGIVGHEHLDELRAKVSRLEKAVAKTKPGTKALARREKQLADTKAEMKRVEAGLAPEERTFEASASAVRIPDVATRKGTKALNRLPAVGGQGTIGHTKAPGSVTHGYTGVLREHGLRREDTTRLVGETALEAAKYNAILHVRDLVARAATNHPVRDDDIAIRMDALKPSEKMPLEVRKFLADPGDFFHNASATEQATVLEKVRAELFVDKAKLDPAARAEFDRLAAEGKVKWVPRRVLGELGRPGAPLKAVAPRGVGTADAINNASRFAILYLKPAYAIPNVLGNAALNLVQQGFAAPKNLAQAARLYQRLDDETYARIDAAMGEGLAKAISAHGDGRLSATVDKGASVWSKVVDAPFRRSSFLHEAKRAGYKTPDEIRDFVNRDPENPELIRVGIRANRDAIDYSNLTPTEREIVRRVVFFYPWVKGSTIYAGRFVREHPVAAAGVGAAGQLGQEYSENNFGPLPSYLEGLIPVGKNRAINPASAAILATPAEVAGAIQGVASGHISDAAQLSNFFTPALSLAESELTRRQGGTGIPYKPGTSGGTIAADTLLGGLPQVSLYRALRAALTGKKNPRKLYPQTVSNALGQFAAGGIYPRTINRERLNQLAASEASRIRTGR